MLVKEQNRDRQTQTGQVVLTQNYLKAFILNLKSADTPLKYTWHTSEGKGISEE